MMPIQFIKQVTSWDNHLIDSINNSLYSHINTWLIAHPLLYWLINHSIISVIIGCVLAIFLIRLFLTIYRSIAMTIDRMWLWILRSPFLLLKFLFGWEIKSEQNLPKTTITNYEIINNSQQIQEILTRLIQIQQQQQQIIQELEIIKKGELNTKQKKIHWQKLPLKLKPPVIDN